MITGVIIGYLISAVIWFVYDRFTSIRRNDIHAATDAALESNNMYIGG